MTSEIEAPPSHKVDDIDWMPCKTAVQLYLDNVKWCGTKEAMLDLLERVANDLLLARSGKEVAIIKGKARSLQNRFLPSEELRKLNGAGLDPNAGKLTLWNLPIGHNGRISELTFFDIAFDKNAIEDLCGISVSPSESRAAPVALEAPRNKGGEANAKMAEWHKFYLAVVEFLYDGNFNGINTQAALRTELLRRCDDCLSEESIKKPVKDIWIKYPEIKAGNN